MREMTGRERIANILKHQPVDRIGIFEHFWGDTLKKWQQEGHISPNQSLADHFGFDMSNSWCFNMSADINFTPEIIEETEDTILKKDGNGAFLRTHKHQDATPEHVDFTVKDRAAWENEIKPLLIPDRARINFEAYRRERKEAHEKHRFFSWADAHVFELMKNVAGHENMLMGMVTDPGWIKDMVMTYSRLCISLLEILFAEEGLPDGVWFFDDLGFKERPFMSPEMYNEIIKPGHKLTFDFIHSLGLPVILHSCGYIEPLIPGMIDAGIDCLQVIEVKAGMDLLKIHRDYGEKIALCGGLDARKLASNNIDAVRAELNEKIPVVKRNFGYILHSDHSIPDSCAYETYSFFAEEGLRLGGYG